MLAGFQGVTIYHQPISCVPLTKSVVVVLNPCVVVMLTIEVIT